MKHTFLFEEGVWHARGAYWDDQGRRVEAEGATRIVHQGLRWSIEGRAQLSDPARTVLENRYETVAFSPESGGAEWVSVNPALGTIRGRFALADDSIISTYATEDGAYAGAEFLLQTAPDRYLSRGFLAKGAVRISAWSVELVRE